MSTAREKYLRLKSLTPNDTKTRRKLLDDGVEYTKTMKADIDTARSKYKAKNSKTKTKPKPQNVAEDSKREESKKRLPKRSEKSKETSKRKESGE